MKNIKFESEIKKDGQNLPMLIWSGKGEGFNEYCLFRKAFVCDKMPKTAVLSIFAQSKYRIFINGESVLRGDCGINKNPELTDINVLPYLKQGKNVIAIFACFYPYHVLDIELRQKGIIFSINLDYSGARQEFIVSDETVKSMVCNAYLKDAPVFDENKKIIEVFDNNLFDEEWTLIDYEDYDWDNAQGKPLCDTMYFDIAKSEYKAVSEHMYSAKAIIAAGTGKDVKGVSLKESIHHEIPKIELNKLYVAGAQCELQPIDKGQYSYIVVDFGRECNGYIKIDVNGYGDDILDVIFVKDIFEGVPEVSGAARFVLRAENNILETNIETNEFKYAILVFRNPVRTNSVNGIWAFEREYNFENVSQFTCQNEVINDAFKDAAVKIKSSFSNKINAVDLYKKREYALSAAYLTGDTLHFKNMLLDIASMQVESGKFINLRQQKCLDFYDVCFFALSIKDYYVLTGDLKTTSDLFKVAISAFKWLSAYESDWLLVPVLAKKNLKSEQLLNALYIYSADALAYVALCCKDLLAYKHYKVKTLKLKKLYKERFLQDQGEFAASCGTLLGDVCLLLALVDIKDAETLLSEQNAEFSLQIELIRALKKSKSIKDVFGSKITELVDLHLMPVFVTENILGILYSKKEIKTVPDADFGNIQAKIYLPKGLIEVETNSESEEDIAEIKESEIEQAVEENQED